MNDHSTSEPNLVAAVPRIERVRHEIRRRTLTVTTVEHVTPQMLRITLTGDELADFVSASPDDHVKIFLASETGEPDRRDYTPRRFDAAARTLALDFAIHEAGPATRWAIGAVPGSVLSIAGPRGSAVVSGARHWLLVGDETALPAIGRRIEEADPGVTITSVVTVAGPAEEQVFETRAKLESIWAHRPLSRATDASDLIAALANVPLAPETFVWIAAEASVARAVRTYLVDTRGHPLPWLKAAGYWSFGKADAREKIED